MPSGADVEAGICGFRHKRAERGVVVRSGSVPVLRGLNVGVQSVLDPNTPAGAGIVPVRHSGNCAGESPGTQTGSSSTDTCAR